jgi:DGQHR domain-containing protein
MAETRYIEFACLQVVQPIGTFYVGVMNFDEVLQISYADVRRIEMREVEVVLGIQRPLSDKRVDEIRKYSKTLGATFPTSIILAVDQWNENEEQNASYDPERGIMKLRNDIRVAKIIDGQHRIAGLINYEGPPFQLNVTLFVDMDIEDQAMVFATINLTQTKVNKSLVYDLYDFAVARSPQKTCHNIAKLLNSENNSPLKGRIKILGRATGKPYEYLTQASFVERLMVYVSRDPQQDRDDIKRGKRLPRATPAEEKQGQLIFRNMFLESRDEDIALVLWNYFSAVAERWNVAWHSMETGFILNRSTGFAALMRFLPTAYLKISGPGQVPKKPNFQQVLAEINLADAEFHRDIFIPGTGGEKRLYEAFMTGRRPQL